MRKWLLLLAVSYPSSAQASGPYLFGLTQADIDDVWSFYGASMVGTTKADLEYFAQAPFNCAKYGDLCADLGPVRAETWVGLIWDRAVAHEDLYANEDLIWVDFDQLLVDYLDTTYPNGIPDQEPQYWGPSKGGFDEAFPLDECNPFMPIEPKKLTDTFAGGTRRMRSDTYGYMTGIYTALGTSIEMHKRASSSSNWRRDNGRTLTINNTYTSVSRSLGCNCTFATADSRTNWKVRSRLWAVGITIEAHHVSGEMDGTGFTHLVHRQTSLPHVSCL